VSDEHDVFMALNRGVDVRDPLGADSIIEISLLDALTTWKLRLP
jgi:hypothetical protein